MKAFVLAALLFSSLSTLAADIKMFDIQSDDPADAGKVTIASIQVKADTTIQNFVYANPNKPTEVYSVDSLNEDKVTLLKKSGVAVVQVSADSISKNSLYLDITYLYKYSLFGSDRRVKRLKLYYVAPSNLYETMDTNTKKVVNHLFVYSRVEDGKQKGIDRIETW